MIQKQIKTISSRLNLFLLILLILVILYNIINIIIVMLLKSSRIHGAKKGEKNKFDFL